MCLISALSLQEKPLKEQLEHAEAEVKTLKAEANASASRHSLTPNLNTPNPDRHPRPRFHPHPHSDPCRHELISAVCWHRRELALEQADRWRVLYEAEVASLVTQLSEERSTEGSGVVGVTLAQATDVLNLLRAGASGQVQAQLTGLEDECKRLQAKLLEQEHATTALQKELQSEEHTWAMTSETVARLTADLDASKQTSAMASETVTKLTADLEVSNARVEKMHKAAADWKAKAEKARERAAAAEKEAAQAAGSKEAATAGEDVLLWRRRRWERDGSDGRTGREGGRGTQGAREGERKHEASKERM